MPQAGFPIHQIEHRPGREHDVGGFRIEPDIELGWNETGVSPPVHGASHHDQPCHARWQLRIETQRQREIGERPERDQREFPGAFPGEAHECRGRCLVGCLAERRKVAGIAESVAPVHMAGILGSRGQRHLAAGEHRNLGTDHVQQLQRIADRVRKADIARRDRQGRDITAGMRHQDRQRVVHAGVGIDQQR